MRNIKGFDFTLMVTPIILAAFGVVMVYSSSMVSAVIVDEVESTYYLYRQLTWFIIGLIVFAITCFIPYQFYQKLIKPIVLISIVLLILVLLFGDTAYRATRSISIGSFNFQPAEFVKLTVILYLASVYSNKQSNLNNFASDVLPPIVLTSIMLILIILQPDIGTSVIILAIAALLVIASGIRFKHIFILSSVSLAFIAIVAPKLATDTRISRIKGAYQPFTEPAESGYHLIQSYIAIGVGGLTGEGLGQSVQKLGYLWGAHTDFIMSIIAEELGFIGVIIVIGLLATIVLRGFYISRQCRDSFGSLLSIGIASLIGVQSFINLGAISGLLPITGVPLPFISYGGSSLIVMFIALGILNNIARSIEDEKTDLRDTSKPIERTTTHQSIYHRGGRTWSN